MKSGNDSFHNSFGLLPYVLCGLVRLLHDCLVCIYGIVLYLLKARFYAFYKHLPPGFDFVPRVYNSSHKDCKKCNNGGNHNYNRIRGAKCCNRSN